MTVKIFDRVKFICTGSSAATLTVAGSVLGFRTPAQVIADTAALPVADRLQVTDTNIPMFIDDGAGNWENSAYTLTSATVLTRTRIVSSSNGGAAVAFPNGSTLTVINDASGEFLRSLLSSADGVAPADLTRATSIVDADDVLVIQGGTLKPLAASVFKAYAGAAGSTTPTVTGVTVSPSTANVAGGANQTFTAAVAGTNSPAQTVTWTASAGAITSGGVFTAPAATASAQTVTITARSTVDTTKTGTATVTVAAASAQTVAVNTPTTQTVGTPFNVTGTYANGTPTALDYRLSDDAAGVWTQVATAMITGGTFSFSVTPASPSVGRTISVRDRATLVSGTSGTYVVNAAATAQKMADIYKVTTGNSASMVASTTTLSASAPDYYAIPKTADGTANQNVRVNVRGINDASLAPSATQCKFVFGLKNQPCPITSFATVGLPQGVNGTSLAGGHGNGFVVAQALTGWTPGQTTNGNYGTITPAATFYGWFGGLTSGQSVTAILWIVFSDDSSKAFHDGAGVPVEFIFTAP